MIDENKHIFRKISDFEISELPDGYIVHDQERGKIHFLNFTAAILLEMCDGENTVSDLEEFLREGFELPSRPAREVETCLADLQSQGLIEYARGEAA